MNLVMSVCVLHCVTMYNDHSFSYGHTHTHTSSGFGHSRLFSAYSLDEQLWLHKEPLTMNNHQEGVLTEVCTAGHVHITTAVLEWVAEK